MITVAVQFVNGPRFKDSMKIQKAEQFTTTTTATTNTKGPIIVMLHKKLQ